MLLQDTGGNVRPLFFLFVNLLLFVSLNTFAAEMTECPSISELQSNISEEVTVQAKNDNEFVIKIAKRAIINKYRWDILTQPIKAECKCDAICLCNEKIQSLVGPNHFEEAPPTGIRGSTTCYYSASGAFEVMAVKRGRDLTTLQSIGAIGALDAGLMFGMLLFLLI